MINYHGRVNTYSIADLENRLHPSDLMPVLFVGHGNPMHAIDDNDFTRTWGRVGAGLPEAQAVVVISAHWTTRGQTHITDAPTNRIIYDFGGFPDELYRVQYETTGDPRIAALLAHHLAEYEASLDAQWGLDHGTWSVLRHLQPHPSVPVLQISLDETMPLPQLHALYARLRALRRRGVLFIGSGNIVHALGRARWDGGGAYEWAEQFDHDTATALADGRVDQLVRPFETWSHAALAVPTDEHYRPMVAALGLLSPGEDLTFFNEAIDMGSIGMRSFITA